MDDPRSPRRPTRLPILRVRTAGALAAAALLAAGAPATAPPAAGEPPPPVTEQRFASWTDSDGTTSTYHLFGLPGGSPGGLVVYLDGDGMEGFDNPDRDVLGGSTGVVQAARARGYATLAIRTPDGRTGTFWKEGPANAAYVAALVRATGERLGTRTTWFLGYSGGAQLVTRHLLPSRPELCGARDGAIVAGGGGSPPGGVPAEPGVPRCRILWATGSADTGAGGYDALGDAHRGSRAYAAARWPAAIWIPHGLTHVGIRAELARLLAWQLDEAGRPA